MSIQQSLDEGDKLCIKNIQLRVCNGVDAWERSKVQPLSLDVCLWTDVSQVGETDNLSGNTAGEGPENSHAISYAEVSKKMMAFAQDPSRHFRSLEALAWQLAVIAATFDSMTRVRIKLSKSKALLFSADAGIILTRSKEELSPSVSSCIASPFDIIYIKDMTLDLIIGVNPWERVERQIVIISFQVFTRFGNNQLILDHIHKDVNYRLFYQAVHDNIADSQYQTVEALATTIAKLLIFQCSAPKVRVKVEKPNALSFADRAGCEITRTASSFGMPGAPNTIYRRPSDVFIGIGSNMGDRMRNIEKALEIMAQDNKLIDTSFLYVTDPMYLIDQPPFLNAVCKIQTTLTPSELLVFLKSIESDLGRDFKTVRNGPRPVDLDILYYDRMILQSDLLVIPHPKIQERPFVLQPLFDISPDMIHPVLGQTTAKMLNKISKKSSGIKQVLPLKPSTNMLAVKESSTLIMGVINMTPDSFSGDGLLYKAREQLESCVKEMITAGVNIIDVGGQSTRPGAKEVSEKEELSRVLPAIHVIRSCDPEVLISVDTYRAAVAEEAVRAGANLVNDVSGGSRDPKMLKVMASIKVPVCLMHMRGDSSSMMSLNNYGLKSDAGEDEVVAIVKHELHELVKNAISAGVRRWNIIVDPGIGFAKDGLQNISLLRALPEIGGAFPMLLGVSRKSFIGKLTGEKDPKARIYGTAGAVAVCIAGGAKIVRVHDVREMKAVAAVVDACFCKK